MKNTQQFCESIYHKYELALETRREKQRVRFMIVQRSAAAAAVVTVAVGSSVFIICIHHPSEGRKTACHARRFHLRVEGSGWARPDHHRIGGADGR